jgi:integrase
LPRNHPQHVKCVRSKGGAYYYFDTGRKSPKGTPIYVRLPDPSDKRAFGGAYAAQLAARSREIEVAGDTLTIPGLIALYQKSPEWRKKAEGTQRIYGIYLRRLEQLLPTAPANEVLASDIARLMDNMGETPGAANLFVRTVATLYRWGRARGHVENKPAEGIEMLELGEHDPWPDAILDAALASDDEDVRLPAHLLFYTAQRIGDVCRLRWSDIRGGVIHVKQQKTDRVLEIPVHDDLARELARTPKRGLFVLHNASGKPRHPQSVRKTLQTFAYKLGAEVVPHGLRKNAVNALLHVGCSVAETAAISGQSLQMVEHYAKKRSQSTLASAAILRWTKGKREN